MLVSNQKELSSYLHWVNKRHLYSASHSPTHTPVEQPALQDASLHTRSTLGVVTLLKDTSMGWGRGGLEPATFRFLNGTSATIALVTRCLKGCTRCLQAFLSLQFSLGLLAYSFHSSTHTRQNISFPSLIPIQFGLQ